MCSQSVKDHATVCSLVGVLHESCTPKATAGKYFLIIQKYDVILNTTRKRKSKDITLASLFAKT